MFFFLTMFLTVIVRAISSLRMIMEARKSTELSTKRGPFIVRSAFSFFSVLTFDRTTHELEKRCFFVFDV